MANNWEIFRQMYDWVSLLVKNIIHLSWPLLYLLVTCFSDLLDIKKLACVVLYTCGLWSKEIHILKIIYIFKIQAMGGQKLCLIISV